MVVDRKTMDAAWDANEGEILRRMLADADRLCAGPDPLIAGQCVQLRGRIAALLDIVATAELPPGRPA